MAKKRYSRPVKMKQGVEMADLPEDVIGEILSRLSVKTLVVLRRVCKSWRSIISDPDFAYLQLGRNIANPNYNDFFIVHSYYEGGFYWRYNYYYNYDYWRYNYYYNYDYWRYNYNGHRLCVINKNALENKPVNLKLPVQTPAIRDRFTVVGSCNGLLCLACFGSLKKKRQHRIYLWNPVTRQLKDIDMKKQNLEHRVSLGFSFDHSSSDYKVVSILTDRFHFVSRVSVYSLNRSCWKTVDHAELKVGVLQHCAVIVKGLFYWLVEENSDPRQFGLVSFNVQSGELITTSLPDGISCRNVFELNGSVAISTEYIDNHGIGIWKQDDERCWVKIRTIKIDRIRELYGCLNTGELFGKAIYDELALCDLANKVITYYTLPKGTLRAYSYSASLVNLNRQRQELPS